MWFLCAVTIAVVIVLIELQLLAAWRPQWCLLMLIVLLGMSCFLFLIMFIMALMLRFSVVRCGRLSVICSLGLGIV